MFSAVRSLIGSAADDLFAVLAATGSDAIGDIDVRLPGEGPRIPNLTLLEARDLIKSLLKPKPNFPLDGLAAIAGSQPKLSIGELVRATRRASLIAKFDSPEFAGLLENEYAFTRLARLCRLDVSETRLISGVLVITRFDRSYNSATRQQTKIHVEDMLQVMDLFPNSKYSLEYVDLLDAMQRLGTSKSTLLDALELYVFCYLIGNGDLHAKNVSLILDKEDGQWRLAPVYDLLSTLPYRNLLTGADRMALALSDDNFGRFTVAEFVDIGSRFELPAKAVSKMLDRLAKAVLKFLPDVLQNYPVPDVTESIAARAESMLGKRAHD